LGNILYQQLKYALQMVVLCVVCGTTSAELNSKYFRILLYATILCTLFNIVSHLYLQFIRKDFPRLEYFLIYAFNGFLFIAQLVYSMQTVFQIQDDQIGPLVLTKSTIFLLLQRELEILLIMVFPLEIGNRQANSCTTNLIVFLLLASNDPISCSQAADLPLTIVALVNLLGLIMTTLFNLVLFK
jgi:hypothetical protein